MNLPKSLLPWAEYLQWFSPELALTLGDLLLRLQPLFGPFKNNFQKGQLEPDGLDDIQRKGQYERLLMSEWLLADEWPDEFIRRAANSEHLFAVSRPRLDRVTRKIEILFDAGPSQLGAPRVLHLALLILLIRRAKTLNAQIRWGVIQMPNIWHVEMDVAALRHLLKSRTAHATQDEHWLEWQKSLTAEALLEPKATQGQTLALERWFIGGVEPESRLKTLSFDSQISICKSIFSAELKVNWHDKDMTKALFLSLPDSELTVQLLNGQFLSVDAIRQQTTSAASHTRISLRQVPVWLANGKALAVPTFADDGILVLYTYSRKVARARPHARRWGQNRKPLALMPYKSDFAAIFPNNDELRFWKILPNTKVGRPALENFKASIHQGSTRPAAALQYFNVTSVYVWDSDGRLCAWRQENTGKEVTFSVVQHRVMAFLPLENNIIIAAACDGGVNIHALDVKGPTHKWPVLPYSEKLDKVFLAHSANWIGRSFGGVALMSKEKDGELWLIYQSEPEFRNNGAAQYQTDRFKLASGWRGLGLWFDPESRKCQLVVMDEHKKLIALQTAGHEHGEIVYRSKHKIVQASLSPVLNSMAIINEHRNLLVLDLRTKTIRHEWNLGGADEQ